MLITGVVTIVTWLVMLVTGSYMRKNGSEVPVQDAVRASWRQGGEMCGPLGFISWLSHLVRSGQAS